MTNAYDKTRDANLGTPELRMQPSTAAFLVTPGNNELEVYADKLQIYVPTDASTVTLIPLLGNDSESITLTFTKGTYTLPLAVRRITAATAGVIIHALHR